MSANTLYPTDPFEAARELGINPDSFASPGSTPAAGEDALRQAYGDQAPAKLALARKLIAQTSRRCPGLIDSLEHSRIGDDPQAILTVVRQAEHLERQGKL